MPERVVECKPRLRNRVFVKLSGGRFFTIPESESLPLCAGIVLTDPEIEKISRIDQYVRGKDKALRLLSIRSRTRHEMETAIDGLDIAREIRNGILQELEEAGLVDDGRFARDYVRVKVDVRRHGPHRLRADLKKKGVAAAIVNDVLQAEFTGDSQEALARDIASRKLGRAKPDEKAVRRLHGLLLRRGIDYEIVNRLIYELLSSPATDEDTDGSL